MAFKRKERKIINFDFEYQEDNQIKTLHFEQEHSKKLSEGLKDITSVSSSWDENNQEKIKTNLIKSYDLILGDGAMDKIREKVYGNDNLLYTDLLDIGYYLLEEINKVNIKIEKEYGDKKLDKSDENLYSLEDIKKMLNEKANGFSR